MENEEKIVTVEAETVEKPPKKKRAKAIVALTLSVPSIVMTAFMAVIFAMEIISPAEGLEVLGAVIVIYILGALPVIASLVMSIPALVMACVNLKQQKNKLTISATIVASISMALVLLDVVLWIVGITIL